VQDIANVVESSHNFLDKVVKVINSLDVVKEINPYLDKISLDTGRVVLFFIVLLFTYIVKVMVDKKLLPLMDKGLKYISDKTDALTMEDVEPVKSPISNLIKLYGLQLALSVLTYKSGSFEFIDLAFYFLYLINFVRLSFVLIDIFINFYFLGVKKKKNIQKRELLNLVVSVVKVVIIIASLLLFLRRLGIDITAFVASLGIGGLAIAMASKDTIANFFGSLKIIFDNSFSQGDWIAVGDVEGTVVELGFVSTKIRTFDNALISLPNSNLANTAVKNYSKRSIGRRIKMKVGVTYDAKQENLQKAIEDIRAMLINHPKIATDEKVKVRKKKNILVNVNDKVGIKTTLLVYLDELADSSINILIYAFTTTVQWQEWLEVKEDILFKIMKIIEDNNLEFAFPSQSLYIEKLPNKD
jgi:MscS family membrane protein